MNLKMMFTTLYLVSTSLMASSYVDIQMPTQTWQFEIKYGLLSQEAARLSTSERDIATRIKPLLTQSNYKAAWQVLETVETKTSSPALAQVKGQVAYQVEKYQAAITAFADALSKRPDLIASHRALAGIYLKQNKQEQALIHLTKTLELGDQDASLFAQMAYLHMQNQQAYAAIAGFRQALFLAPNNQDYKRGLLWALTESGDIHEASHLLNQLIEQTPNDPDLWLRLSQIQLQQNQEKQALASLEIAQRLGNNATANLVLSAQLHLNQGSTEQTVHLLSKVLQKNDNKYTQQIISVLSMLVNKQAITDASKLADALSKHKNTLDFKTYSQLLTYQGVLAERQANTKQAKAYFEQAISKDATNANAMLKMGQLLQSEQEFSRADSYFVRASSFTEHQEMAWLSSAQIAIEQGSYTRAIDFLNKAYKANPSRRDLLTNIKQLEQLQRAL